MNFMSTWRRIVRFPQLVLGLLVLTCATFEASAEQQTVTGDYEIVYQRRLTFHQRSHVAKSNRIHALRDGGYLLVGDNLTEPNASGRSVLKVDSEGKQQWGITLSNDANTRCSLPGAPVLEGKDGSVYLLGVRPFDYSVPQSERWPSGAPLCIVKLDHEGRLLWIRPYHVPTNKSFDELKSASRVLELGDGIVFTGLLGSTVTKQPTPTGRDHFYYRFMLKIGPEGELLWLKDGMRGSLDKADQEIALLPARESGKFWRLQRTTLIEGPGGLEQPALPTFTYLPDGKVEPSRPFTRVTHQRYDAVLHDQNGQIVRRVMLSQSLGHETKPNYELPGKANDDKWAYLKAHVSASGEILLSRKWWFGEARGGEYRVYRFDRDFNFLGQWHVALPAPLRIAADVPDGLGGFHLVTQKDSTVDTSRREVIFHLSPDGKIDARGDSVGESIFGTDFYGVAMAIRGADEREIVTPIRPEADESGIAFPKLFKLRRK